MVVENPDGRFASCCPLIVLHVHETPFYWWLPWGVGGFCSTLLRWGSKGPLATLRKGVSDLPRFIYSSYTDSLRTHDHPAGWIVFAVGPRGTTKTLNHELWTAGGYVCYFIYHIFLHSYCYTYPWRTRGDIGAILHRYVTLYFMWFRNQVYWTNVTIF